MYVYGGQGEAGILSDLWVLNATWFEIEPLVSQQWPQYVPTKEYGLITANYGGGISGVFFKPRFFGYPRNL